MSFEVFCDPQFGQTLRTDCTTLFDVGVISATAANSAILGGIPAAAPTNYVGADLSVIVMGDNNCIIPVAGGNGCLNIIGNGINNTLSGCYGNIFNGNGNTADGCYVSIFNGNANVISLYDAGPPQIDSCYVSIFNGQANEACGQYVSVDNGFCNIAGGCHVSIVNGECNIIGFNSPGASSAFFSTIINGCCNRIYERVGSTIAGGMGNDIDSEWSFIGSGEGNRTSSVFSTLYHSAIVGGRANSVCYLAEGSFIGAGDGNCMFNRQSSLVSGNNSGVCAMYSFMGGGFENRIREYSDMSAIVGGCQNIIEGHNPIQITHNFIGAGSANHIYDRAIESVIVGGSANHICQDICYGFVGGGNFNVVDGNYSTITAGCNNRICHIAGKVDFSSIAAGSNNLITFIGDSSSFIGAGNTNNIYEPGSIIGSGTSNTVTAAYSGIVGGNGNTIDSGSAGSFIGGGVINTIGASGSLAVINSVIGGGYQNTIMSSNLAIAEGNMIGGGYSNYIYEDSNFSGIIGGLSNRLAGDGAVIGGGCLNYIGGTVGTGTPRSDFSFIGGGKENQIFSVGGGVQTQFGVVGGGESNWLDPGAMHSSVFSGWHNCAAGACSVILGGEQNTITGDCSAILGGVNNTDSGNANIFILGNNIAATTLPAGKGGLFANELVITNVPGIPIGAFGTLVTGEVYTTNSAPGFRARRLYIV